MSDEKKLFLIDAYALIYRAHFAFSKNPRINSKGFNTSCIFGFTNSMLEVIKKENPSHLGICFDTPEPTFRHVEYIEYKAQRQEQPEDITCSIPVLRDLLSAWGIPILELSGFEADDVCGTIAKKAGAAGFQVYMMTSDKDYCQIVDENIYLYKPNFIGKGYEVLDVPTVLEKWEISRIDQVTDILGLQGDSVDNIPGIPGIGKKTAIKLLQQYDTVENLVAHAHELKGKQRENVENFGAQGILSKRLATIKLDVPIAFDPDALVYDQPVKDKLMPIFDELEFKGLTARVFGEDVKKAPQPKAQGQMDLFSSAAAAPAQRTEEAEELPQAPRKTIDGTHHNYHFINTPEARKSLIKFLEMQDELCFDTETTSIDAYEAELVGISFSYYEGDAYYVPVPKEENEAQAIVDEFKAVFEDESIAKVGQNLKYDIIVLKNYGVNVKGKIFDTMLAHYLLQPEMRHNMDLLAETYLNYTPVSIETLIGKKGKNQGNMADLAPEEVSDYACEDADITFQLKNVFAPMIQLNDQVRLLHEVEGPLVQVLADVERNGVRVDEKILSEMSKELETGAKELEETIYSIAGEEFNIASPKQLGEILFDKLKLDPKAKKTKTGQYATGEDILSRLADDNEIISHILSFREYKKLKSTYVDALPKMISPKDGRIHTSYRQAVAATGRLSSDNPNLQNIPIRTAKGREIRKAFVPTDENHVLFSADYSQIELRIMAEFCKDESMIDAFKSGRDIHATTASKVFKTPLEEVTADQRRSAKSVNFGIIYGISAFGLSQNLNISRTEAAEIIEAYFTEFPAIKNYMDKVINDAREVEYVETILGRRRYLRDINSRNQTQRGFAERNAINAPIQGSAADMIKVAMIDIHRWMQQENLKSKMILQVHDELVFDTHRDELDLLKAKIPEFMSNAITFEVPMEIGVGTGKNWLEAH